MPTHAPVHGYSRPFDPTKPLHAEELAWFIENAPRWPWRWAKTFAQNAPHSYVMKGQQLNAEIYERAVRVVMALGQPANYYKRVNLELHLPGLEMEFGAPFATEKLKGFKFWPMTNQMTISKAFNVAPLHFTYGEQTAPATVGPLTEPSQFDFVAADWDDVKAESYKAYAVDLWKLVIGDQFVPSLIELGPTTGYAADLGLVPKRRLGLDQYIVVDGSQGMLNQVVFKHGDQPVSVESVDPNQWLDPWYPLGTRRAHTVVSLFGAASYLKPEALPRALEAAERQLVLMHHRVDGHQQDLGIRIPEWSEESRKAARQLPGSYTFQMGDYDVTVVKK